MITHAHCGVTLACSSSAPWPCAVCGRSMKAIIARSSRSSEALSVSAARLSTCFIESSTTGRLIFTRGPAAVEREPR